MLPYVPGDGDKNVAALVLLILISAQVKCGAKCEAAKHNSKE